MLLALLALAAGRAGATVYCWPVPDYHLSHRDYAIEPQSWLAVDADGSVPIPIAGTMRLREADPCSWIAGENWFAQVERLDVAGEGVVLASPPASVVLGATTFSADEGTVGWTFTMVDGLYTMIVGASGTVEQSMEPLGEDDGRLRRTWFQRDPETASSYAWESPTPLPDSLDLHVVLQRDTSLCHVDGMGGYGCSQETGPETIGAMRLVATAPEPESMHQIAAAVAVLAGLGRLSRRSASRPRRAGSCQ